MKHRTKVVYLVILGLIVLLSNPLQVSKASPESCAAALAEASLAYAEMQAQCEGAPGGGACQMLQIRAAQLIAEAAAECSQ